jgi:hypothetical protein
LESKGMGAKNYLGVSGTQDIVADYYYKDRKI